jgi:hypothetical protein
MEGLPFWCKLLVLRSCRSENAVAGIVIAAALIVVLADSFRRRYIFRGWHSWPIAEATVEAAEVRAYRGDYFVDIGYSYAVNSSFMTEWDARVFLARPKRKPTPPVFGGKRLSFGSILRIQNLRIDQGPVSLS